MWPAITIVAGVLASYVAMAWRWWVASKSAADYKRSYELSEASNKDLLIKYSRQHNRLKAVEKQYGNILRKYSEQMSVDELIEFDRQLQDGRKAKPE